MRSRYSITVERSASAPSFKPVVNNLSAFAGHDFIAFQHLRLSFNCLNCVLVKLNASARVFIKPFIMLEKKQLNRKNFLSFLLHLKLNASHSYCFSPNAFWSSRITSFGLDSFFPQTRAIVKKTTRTIIVSSANRSSYITDLYCSEQTYRLLSLGLKLQSTKPWACGESV